MYRLVKMNLQILKLKKWGTIRHFDFEVKDHTQLGEALNILDFERATKITWSTFCSR